MATKALERGGLERHLLVRAEVLETDATGVLVRTAADRQPWPHGPFPSPPEPSRAGRHLVEVEGHPGQVVLDASPSVELRG